MRNITDFPDEEEWLFVSCSLFQVTHRENGIITLKTMDNKTTVDEKSNFDGVKHK